MKGKIMKGKRRICLAAILAAVLAAGPAFALAPSGHVGSVLPSQAQTGETEPPETEPVKAENHNLMPAGGIGSVVPTSAEPEVPGQADPETSSAADSPAGESGKELSYRRAMEFMEAGDYDMAIAILEILGDYGDSMVQLAMAKNAKQKVVYDQAADMMKAGQYEAAREVFLSLGSYRDSALQAAACRQLQEEQAKAEFAQAEAVLFENGITGKVVSEEAGLTVYRQEGGDWVLQSTTRAPLYRTLVIITDSLGRCYLRADTDRDTDIYLFEEVWKLLVSVRDRGEDLQWTVTESGFLINRADSRNPGSRLETEFIVLAADQVLGIGPDAP